ncbi:Mcm22p [Saccharomyces paradoxus]|uniref:Mcm22p n=1 Tax=Saccharomyces paradoxus TaxID=27291 RepID=A0A8B8UUK3_SACPA|nr:Mcm22 [Saccharomyces paradoxus]QHS74359.1 Mcm22 [Saccharomyces paradoxus]
MDTEKDILDVYIKNLENQIGNKRYFLKQARSAIDEITKKSLDTEGKPLDFEIFAELLRKPMFLSERADPISFSLSSNFLSLRAQSSSEWLSVMDDQSVDKKAMLSLQNNINSDLKELLRKLQRQVCIIDDTKQDRAHVRTRKARNKELWNLLEDFLKSYLVPNLDDNDQPIDNLTSEVTLLLKRLIEHDLSLTLRDFSSKTMPIYRLLLRANIITVTKGSSNPETKYIKLINFNETSLT